MYRWPVLLFALLTVSCSSLSPGTGEPRPPTGTEVPQPANPQASVESAALLKALSQVSFGGTQALVGQNVYHGSQILEGYGALVASLETAYGDLPALVGVDYEHDRIFTPQELTACNQVLKDFAARGGLVTINWSPQSPWANDESDLVANPGTSQNTRSQALDMSKVNLLRLLDPRYPESVVWRRKLDRIAAALKELQQEGIPVLWRPLQEMNGNWFWWGSGTQPGDAEGYRALWIDMFEYFSRDKGLDNLLWVYSPAATTGWPSTRSVTWAYPGDDYVDVVAGTAYNDSLDIRDYPDYLRLGKPLAMAEYGTDSWGQVALSGTLDNHRSLRNLKASYPRMAYWVCWHDWDWGNGTSAHHSLASNRNTAGLFADPRTLTLKRWSMGRAGGF